MEGIGGVLAVPMLADYHVTILLRGSQTLENLCTEASFCKEMYLRLPLIAPSHMVPILIEPGPPLLMKTVEDRNVVLPSSIQCLLHMLNGIVVDQAVV